MRWLLNAGAMMVEQQQKRVRRLQLRGSSRSKQQAASSKQQAIHKQAATPRSSGLGSCSTLFKNVQFYSL